MSPRKKETKPRPTRKWSLIPKEILAHWYFTEFMTQAEIAKELGVTQYLVHQAMKGYGLKARVAAKRNQWGERHHNWRGEDASYHAFHNRVRARRGSASFCSKCGKSDSDVRYEWANLTGNYADPEDYVAMCVSCHRKFDAERRVQ